MADTLNWTKGIVSAVANRFGISGASEPNLSKAYSKTKDLSSQTAADLMNLLFRFTKMAATFEPFSLRLDDPDHAKQLLEDFEAGKLVVQINRQEPGASIHGVFVIENVDAPNRLFQGIRNGKPSWGFQGAFIGDREVADTAVKILEDVGFLCRVLLIQNKTVESEIVKNLAGLGFVFQEKGS